MQILGVRVLCLLAHFTLTYDSLLKAKRPQGVLSGCDI